MPNQTSEKIIARFKGLRDHMQADEIALFAVPAIWDAGVEQRSTACDVIITNQRLIAYYFVSFPRERLFFDALTLPNITTVTLRQKSFEPLFRELLVSDGQRKVYIRAPRQKIESLYNTLRSTITEYTPENSPTFESTEQMHEASTTQSSQRRPAPVYGRQEIRRPFDNSPLAIVMLFVGGLGLEIIGLVLWFNTANSQTGLPLCIAGLVAVIFSVIVMRQRRRSS